jgi:hypothetical protein
MTPPSVHIEIDSDSALVLFELLARFDETDRIEISDRSEAFALWKLHGALERQVPVFSGEYARLVDNARRALRILGGEPS